MLFLEAVNNATGFHYCACENSFVYIGVVFIAGQQIKSVILTMCGMTYTF